MTVRGSQFPILGALAFFAMAGEVLAEEPVTSPTAVAIVESGEAASLEMVLDATSAAIRDLIAEAGHHGSFLDKRDAAAVAEFYAERNYLAAWVKDGIVSEQVQALIARIDDAEIDGLDSSAYTLPTKGLLNYAASMPEFTAQADLMLSQAIVAYTREAYSGRIDPSKISGDIGYKRRLPDLIEALKTIAAADVAVDAMVAYNPPHPEFAALRDKLAELRNAGEPDKPIEMPEGKALKLGVEHARVGFLRKRLELPTDVESPALFDEEVAKAVKAFQRSSRLAVDGVVGPRTIAALNADPVDPIPTILINMEKWRWMDRDLGQFYVRVNVPDFTVNVFDKGKVIHETRVVLGKPKWKTPIFSDEIEHIVVNPSWYVPASIAQNEMLPEVRANPSALSGYEVSTLVNGSFRPVNARKINWSTVDMRKIRIRQPPGRGNALGRVKFMFPNKYSVYLHDTPSKSLFKRDYRAFSHGCVRVMNPMEFAEALLTREAGRDSAYLESLYGSSEKQVNLKTKIPVHITYFTAWVDELGELQTRDDLYGHDRRIAKGVGTS